MRRPSLIFIGLAILATFICAASLGCQGEEEIVKGNVTEGGLLEDNDGNLYSMVGKKADEVKGLAGERFQIKGTVKERKGKRTISVKEYILIQDKPEDPYAPSPSVSQTPKINYPEENFQEPDEEMGMEEDTTEPAQEEPEPEYDME